MSSPEASRDYLISRREIRPGWLLLYAVTFALQLPVGAFRALIATPVLWLALTVAGEPTASVHTLAMIAGYGPLALSLATLLLPLGG